MPLCFPDVLYYFASQPTDSRNSRYDPKLTIIAALFVCIDHLAHDPPIHSSPKWCIHNSMRVAGGSVLMLCWSVDCGWACGEKLKRGSTRAAWYYWGLKNIGLICLRFHPHRRRAIAACIIFRGFFSYATVHRPRIVAAVFLLPPHSLLVYLGHYLGVGIAKE